MALVDSSDGVHIELSELTLEGTKEASESFGSADELTEQDDMRQEKGSDIIPGNSGLLGAGFNFVNSIVGAGIIGLAFAVNEVGFILGSIMLCFVAYLTYESVKIMVNSGIQVKQYSYEGLCEFCFGKTGFNVVSFFMVIFAFGAMCAYLVIIGDTVPVVMLHLSGHSASRNLIIAVFAVFVILPLCLLRDMAGLSWSSSISIGADFVVVLIVLFQAQTGAEEWVDPPIVPDYSFAGSNIFAGLGAMMFSYVCQHSSFIVFATLKTPTAESWEKVNRYSVLSAFLMSITLALSGYLAFFRQTQANVLNNFGCEDVIINTGRLLLALTMVFTFPMEQFVARHSLFALCKGYSPELKGPNRMSNLWHYGITFALWGCALIVGLTVRDLGVILEFTGALAASVLGYILPPLCYFKVNSFRDLFSKSCCAFESSEDKTFYQKFSAVKAFYVPFLMLLFGITALIIGTITAFMSTTETSAECVPASV